MENSSSSENKSRKHRFSGFFYILICITMSYLEAHMIKKKDKMICLRIEKELYELIEKESSSNYTTVSQSIRRILLKYYEKNK